MSTVEQIHHLENRVDRLLGTLRELRTANDSLRGELAASEERAAELERLLATSEAARQEADRKGADLEQRLGHLLAEQEEIEATIARTLEQLGKLEIGTAADEAAEESDDGALAVEAEVAAADDAETEADAETSEPAVLHDDDEEQPAADEADAEPDANTDHREGDDLDIF